MRNHKIVEGKLLQTNKTWKDLKSTQKEWIDRELYKLYIKFVSDNGHKPNIEEKDDIVKALYLEIEEREIWIPYVEVRRHFSSKINSYDTSIKKLDKVR